MLRRRTGRPGLIGTMARTAVIAGTASAVSGGVQRSQQQQQQQQAAAQAAQAAQAQPAATAQQPPPADDTVAQLVKLGELRQAGLLDDAEFASAKAKLLGI